MSARESTRIQEFFFPTGKRTPGVLRTAWAGGRWVAPAAVFVLVVLGARGVGRGQDEAALSPGQAGSAGTAPVGSASSVTIQLSVRRQGRVLVLNFNLHGITNSDSAYWISLHPPRFTAYRGGREVGSGTLQYG